MCRIVELNLFLLTTSWFGCFVVVSLRGVAASRERTLGREPRNTLNTRINTRSLPPTD